MKSNSGNKFPALNFKMVKSNTKIEKQLSRKRNSILVDTIISAKKNKNWLSVAGILSGSRKSRRNLNLKEIENLSGKEKAVLVTGKVLSEGNIGKKLKVVALGFSERAKEKLLNAGCEVSTINEEIKKNPSAEGIKILK